ncbi:SCP2 sterol-binding domain-containing protein [Bradyrhizobium sp. G127]|uniref:ubiquinone anaerobic biosynthesis accessory factor UbiT n=1 Tax=Bradyrhizobium sp. G127 TaxID=2904800 RepID=UPI001F369897|nr:SCP2 sterol-binding domain-containing protein [Bradyrhizobium sp. G127]MCF2524686.1 SCP2 sterol-binding domain-containing protein [Bradyrhizobium sp. G127]
MPVSDPSISRVPLVFALAGRVLPLFPLQPMLAASLYGIQKRHPQIFDRLGAHAAKLYGLDPTDLPFAFVLEPSRVNPRVTATRILPRRIDVRITGPLAALIGLVDGACDGDALFFSRDIQIEGDMEAAVALRNAIDDAGIDIVAESVAWTGPLSPIVERLARGVIGDPPGQQRSDLASEGGSWN